MKRLIAIGGLFLALAFASAALAQTDIRIADARARPTPPGAGAAAVYLTIVNQGSADDTLTAVATPVADRAAAHRTGNANGIMTMEAVPSLTVKAGGQVVFAPGGLHIMLTGLKQALAPGQTFPLTLTFAKAGEIGATVTVVPIGGGKGRASDMPGMKMD